MTDETDAVEVIRRACLALPEVEERLSHGAPTFFVRRSFASVWVDGHHGERRSHAWFAAADGIQQVLTSGRPEHFFRPPYVGHRGWIGVRLDSGLGPDELADFCEDAYRVVAPTKLLKALDATGPA